jgi:Icc-related predicted phosphoesterase
MKLILISDTHLRLHRVTVPDGDVLVHAGDLTFNGDVPEIKKELDAIASLPHEYKVIIAGNHDWLFQRDPNRAIDMCRARGIIWLQDDIAEIGGLKFWGTAWQPEFCGWAFNLNHGWDLEQKWDMIPDDTNVLITHCPPYGIGDLTTGEYGPPEHVGCRDLKRRIESMRHLKLHVFGHIHSGYGKYGVQVNASICNERYEPVNPPIVVDL